jgi:hypothetical protein
VSVKAVGLGDESWNLQGPRFDFAMTSSPNAVVGFDVAYEPAESAVEWSFYEDEKALPADHFFVGPFGVPSHGVRAGLFGEEAKDECLGAALPAVRPQVDRGLFVVCGPEKGFRTDGADPGGLGSGLDPTWMSSLGYGSPWRTVKK